MAVRSRPFWLATAPAAATTTLYTVPANRVALVRLITISNTGALGNVATIRADLGSGPLAIWSGTVPGAGTSSIPVPVILSEGDVLDLVNGGAAALRSFGCGSLLDGDPE